MGTKKDCKVPLIQRQRSQRGSGLALAVCGLTLIAAIFVGGSFFLVASGMTTYYKTKLDFIARQGAKYAARQATNREQNTRQFVLDMFKSLGLPDDQVNVQVADAFVDGSSAVQVTVVAGNLPLLRGSNILPGDVSLKDSASDTQPLQVVGYIARTEWVDPYDSGFIGARTWGHERRTGDHVAIIPIVGNAQFDNKPIYDLSSWRLGWQLR